jgi:hypothetical protein
LKFRKFNKKLFIKPRSPRWLPVPFRTGWLLSLEINKIVSEVLNASDLIELNSVEGYLTEREGIVLFYFAYSRYTSGRVLEIGSFKGKSTAWMAKALKLSQSDDKVVAIDPHVNAREFNVVPNYKDETSYDAFLRNISRMNLSDQVDPIKMTSQKAAEHWNQQIRLLFVDGSHNYEDVVMDLKLWQPWVSIGGVVCMHDTDSMGPFPGVRRAMNEYLGTCRRLKKILELNNMTVFKKLV